MPSRGGYHVNGAGEWAPDTANGAHVATDGPLVNHGGGGTVTYSDGPDSTNPGKGACITGTGGIGGGIPQIGGAPSLQRGDIVIVKNQVNAAENGVYYVDFVDNEFGDGSPGDWKLTRHPKWDEPKDFGTDGWSLPVNEGTNAGRTFGSTSAPSDIGTDPIDIKNSGVGGVGPVVYSYDDDVARNVFQGAGDSNVENFIIRGRTASLAVGPQQFIRPDSLIVAFPSVAGVVTLVSSSADDAFPAGIGAQIILVEGLDASGDPIGELFFMTGTTPVVGVSTFSFVNRMIVAGYGVGPGANVGEITATLDGVVNEIMAPNESCAMTSFKVPNDARAVIKKVASAGDQSNALMDLAIQNDTGNLQCVLATLDYEVSNQNDAGREAEGYAAVEGEVIYFRGTSIGGPAPAYAAAQIRYYGPAPFVPQVAL